MKSGNLIFLELSGPLQACNGTALPLPFTAVLDFSRKGSRGKNLGIISSPRIMYKYTKKLPKLYEG